MEKKVKLQWFQFPSGLRFSNNIFGTAQVANVFKTKEAFLPLQSYKVLSVGIEPTSYPPQGYVLSIERREVDKNSEVLRSRDDQTL